VSNPQIHEKSELFGRYADQVQMGMSCYHRMEKCRIWSGPLARAFPEQACKEHFLRPADVEINRRCGEPRVAHPALHKRDGDAGSQAAYAKRMAKALRARLDAADPRPCHDRFDNPPCRDAAPWKGAARRRHGILLQPPQAEVPHDFGHQAGQQRYASNVLPGNSNKFVEIVKQVQAAMLAFGYFNGEINGIVGPKTREALQRMQADYGLKVTGTITPEILNALRITAR